MFKGPKLIALFFVILIVLAVGGLMAVEMMVSPVSPGNIDGMQSFTIPKGQAISIIGQRLAEAHLIQHPLAFRIFVKVHRLENKIQAGSFQLHPGMSLSEVAQTLTAGTDDLWVTIPEGWRKEEIAESLDRQELPEFDQAEFLELAAASEGKLYPDTYLVAKTATAETMYTLLTTTFDQKVTQDLADEIATSDHTLDEAIIMASIIEREALGEAQMRHVSGVLWNRIELGMPLQADATLQYIKGYNQTQKAWWVPPTVDDKKIVSPFNTYLNPGLPPRPIANPGAPAIAAALDPDSTDDLFYIHDREGEIHFAETLDQHNANVNKYLR